MQQITRHTVGFLCGWGLPSPRGAGMDTDLHTVLGTMLGGGKGRGISVWGGAGCSLMS